MSSRSEQELQEDIADLRSELGETVEALAYKADVPTRVKQRGGELTEHALERGTELFGQSIERSSQLREQLTLRGSELRDQAIDAAERAREAVSRTPTQRWAQLAGAGLVLIILSVVTRRVRTR